MNRKATETIRYLTAQWVLPVVSEPIEWGFVAIQGHQILSVGRYDDLPKGTHAPAPKPNSLLSPGLINTHVHLEQSFPEPIAKTPQDNFISWLLQVIEKTRGQNNSESKLARCRFGVLEALRTGTTSVNDIASGPESIQAMGEAGLQGIISLEVFHPGFEPIQIDHWLQGFSAMQAAAEPYPFLSIGLSPHSPYNVSPKAWQALLKALQPSLVHTHLGEFEDETAYLAGKPSKIINLHQQVLGKTFRPELPARSPVQALMRKGLLETPTVIAHAIHLTESDRQELRTLPVSIAHCPRSNLALHGKTLHWNEWQSSSIPIGLGTDGRLSTPDLDLRAEARVTMDLHGWSARQALQTLTVEGARVLRQDSQRGSLKRYQEADLVLWQAEPGQNLSPEELLLAPSTKAQTVIIGGQPRYQAKTT